MKLIDNKPAFGKNLKYLLALTLLAWITYSLPSVQAAMSSQIVDNDSGLVRIAYIPSMASQLAASGGVAPSILSPQPPQSANCPSGYVCILKDMMATWCPPGFTCTPIAPKITSFTPPATFMANDPAWRTAPI